MSGGRDARSGWAVVIALLVADMVYGFQQTAISPALPTVQQDLSASREWTVWLFSGYLIVGSVAPVFLGKLGDRIGRTRVYVWALVVFTLGSVATAVAPNIELVVVFRMVQGVGGVVFPLSFAIATEALPRDKVNSAIGILTGGFGFGAVVGFPVGGALAETLSWRWIFGVGALALALAVVMVRLVVPTLGRRVPRGLDTPGAVLFGGAIAALIVAITEGPHRGWTGPLPLAMFALAVALAAAWYWRETHTREPLMDLQVLRSRGVLLTNLTSLFGGYAVFGTNMLLPFLLQGTGEAPGAQAFGLAAGPLLIGIVLMPRAVGQAVFSPLTGPLVEAFGHRAVFTAGMVLSSLATFGLAFLRGQLWLVMVELLVLGVGFGFVVSLSGSIIALAAEPGETGIATSITSVLRRAGGAVGAQVSIAVLALLAGPDGGPSHTAYSVGFGICGLAGLAGVVCAALVVPRRRGRAAAAPQARDEDF